MEASRLGCHAYAGDLNPLACRILRATIEDPAKLILSDAPSQGTSCAIGRVKESGVLAVGLPTSFLPNPVQALHWTAICGLCLFVALRRAAASSTRRSRHSLLFTAQPSYPYHLRGLTERRLPQFSAAKKQYSCAEYTPAPFAAPSVTRIPSRLKSFHRDCA